MSKNRDGPDFFTKINKIINYFARNSNGGFLFCSFDKTAVIDEIVKTIIYRGGEKGLDIKEVYFSSEDAERFLQKIREAVKEKPDGIIISNLGELIILTKDQIIKDINLARDILLGLKLPFLFCISSENISKFANMAQDLFLRRDRGVIHFPEIPGITKMEILKELHTLKYRDSEDFKSLNLKLGLLEGQLKEAEEKKYNPERIANEIAIELILFYLRASLIQEANELFNKYKSFFNLEDNLITINIVANLYVKLHQWDKGLDLLFKIKGINERVGDKSGIARTLNNIGLTYDTKGEWDKALKFYLKSKEITDQELDFPNSAAIYHNIGNIYFQKGEMDKAFEYYYKSKEIHEQIGDKAGLARTLNNIGLIYYHKGESKKAIDLYFQSKEIWEKTGDIWSLVEVLYNIGIIYDHINEWDKALDLYLNSKEMCERVGNTVRLWSILNNIGVIYDKKRELDKALDYYLKAREILEKIGDQANLKIVNENINSINKKHQKKNPND